MQIPNLNDEHVKDFCNSISIDSAISVRHEPLKNVPENECFSIVGKQVEMEGGRSVLGWAVWEWPNVMIEAEFHSIWQSSEGEYIDLSPRPRKFENIVFIPDTSKKYDGRQVNNIRKAMNKSFITKQYIETANSIYREMNKGRLAYMHGGIEVTSELKKLFKKMEKLKTKLVSRYGAA